MYSKTPNSKPTITITIPQDLITRLESDRLAKVYKEQRDINRSQYITDVIRKGLEKEGVR
jgi:metal-responsive CopG/Arc/MetJ family transcriptional regulator